MGEREGQDRSPPPKKRCVRAPAAQVSAHPQFNPSQSNQPVPVSVDPLVACSFGMGLSASLVSASSAEPQQTRACPLATGIVATERTPAKPDPKRAPGGAAAPAQLRSAVGPPSWGARHQGSCLPLPPPTPHTFLQYLGACHTGALDKRSSYLLFTVDIYMREL